MGSIACCFLIFGWIFHIKGLLIATLVLSSIGFPAMIVGMVIEANEIVPDSKKISSEFISFIIYLVLFILSIIAL